LTSSRAKPSGRWAPSISATFSRDGARSCVEEVVAYDPERMVTTRMVSDTWGIDRMLTDFVLVSTVSRRTDTSTILKFQAFYQPLGLKNRLLNALFLRRALRKRGLAVLEGIKRLAERSTASR
jgi:hypothetical protein